MKNWAIFIKERFEPFSHSIMILVFLSVHYLIARKLNLLEIETWQLIPLAAGVTLFYFKLRLYDEVKDYELDVIINKHRPLPRGLLHHRDMYRGMIFCISMELICFLFSGINAFLAILMAILYSLLMYKEFFIREKIRPHLTTYAILHTIVTSFLSLAIFSFLTKQSILTIIANKYFMAFAFVNWLLFNIFEFGRKTFASEEERDNVDTYSSLFGRKGAALLVISQRLASIFIIISLDIFQNNKIYYAFAFILVILIFSSLKYVLTDSKSNAKLFRLMSSIYIIIFYIILAIGLI